MREARSVGLVRFSTKMADEQKKPNNNNNKPSSSSSGEIHGSKGGGGGGFSGQKLHYPNQRETSIPDAATLRDQWKFAIRQYSKRSSQAWGAAIFAGVSLYALGWIIKGSNPVPSTSSRKQPQQDQEEEDDHK